MQFPPVFARYKRATGGFDFQRQSRAPLPLLPPVARFRLHQLARRARMKQAMLARFKAFCAESFPIEARVLFDLSRRFSRAASHA
jgi:hypothetical protein